MRLHMTPASKHSAASEARRAEASGPQTNAAAWKGMGPHRYPASRPAQPCFYYYPLPTRFLLPLLMCYTVAWTSVSGFVQNSSNCQIDLCWEQYETAKDHFEQVASSSVDNNSGGGAGIAVLDSKAQCVALRTYWSCIRMHSRGCQGDIRYYSVRNGVKNQMKQYNCSVNGPTLDHNRTREPQRSVPYECHYHGPKVFRHCGLFGDPHLRTFHNQFQTCRVRGAWPIVNNDYLTVQVTNDPVPGGTSDATATSKLTVIVKSHPECGSSQFQTYQAQTDSLPGSFDDGHNVYGSHGGLELVEVEPNKHVEIHIKYINTTVVVRQIGRYFTFAIRMPEELVNSSHSRGELELCTRGCPASERINYQEYLAERRDRVPQVSSTYDDEDEDDDNNINNRPMSRHEAEAACRDAQLVDFYFDSCVFDLMATGDRNFTLAAIIALKDLLHLDPAMAKQLSNRTDPELKDSGYSGTPSLVSRQSVVLRVTWTLVLALVTLFYPHIVGNR